MKISRNENVKVTELFKFKNLFLPSIGATLLYVILTYLGILLFIIPGIIIAFNYCMVYFVIADNPGIGVMDALRKSAEIMLGHRLQYLILSLSFIGWYILYFGNLICLSFLGWDILYYLTSIILLLCIAPYIMVTTANFYNVIKEEV